MLFFSISDLIEIRETNRIALVLSAVNGDESHYHCFLRNMDKIPVILFLSTKGNKNPAFNHLISHTNRPTLHPDSHRLMHSISIPCVS